MSAYTIGEAAERSGFSASALRYYEGIGLVAPSARSDAGYRLYDDDDLVRLSFVARAKQLGCSLEEITDLVGLWDGERCGPVQRRFHDLVTTKIDQAQRHIEELTMLVDQLRETAAHLAGPAIDGPCSATCACAALGGTASPVPAAPAEGDGARPPMLSPLVDETVPIACTIAPEEVAARVELLENLRARLAHIERTAHGLLLVFPADPGIEADVRRFADDEQRCCRFWGFALVADDGHVSLQWDGPPAADPLLASLHTWFLGEEPLTTISELWGLL